MRALTPSLLLPCSGPAGPGLRAAKGVNSTLVFCALSLVAGCGIFWGAYDMHTRLDMCVPAILNASHPAALFALMMLWTACNLLLRPVC